MKIIYFFIKAVGTAILVAVLLCILLALCFLAPWAVLQHMGGPLTGPEVGFCIFLGFVLLVIVGVITAESFREDF